MEQNVVDLKKVEEETKEKIKAVNFLKVTIATAIVAQMKVWNIQLWNKTRSRSSCVSYMWGGLKPLKICHFYDALCSHAAEQHYILHCALTLPPSSHRLQLRAKLTMEKVHLALEMAGLTAEKNKLENDCRDSASEFKTMEVSSATHCWIAAAFLPRIWWHGLHLPSHCSKDAAVWSWGSSSWLNSAKACWRGRSPTVGCSQTRRYQKTCAMLVFILHLHIFQQNIVLVIWRESLLWLMYIY